MLRSNDFARHSRPVGVSGKIGWKAGCQNAEFQTSIMPAISASVAGESVNDILTLQIRLMNLRDQNHKAANNSILVIESKEVD